MDKETSTDDKNTIEIDLDNDGRPDIEINVLSNNKINCFLVLKELITKLFTPCCKGGIN